MPETTLNDAVRTTRLDAVVNDSQGRAVTLENAICIHEEDYGILWKHFDWRTGYSEVRRSDASTSTPEPRNREITACSVTGAAVIGSLGPRWSRRAAT